MKKVELLAPAGNMDALKAAVAGGCDAVYLGLRSFSARAFAGNFDHDELIEAVRYCHIRNVSVYVTLNTMLFEKEIENIKNEVDFLYKNDVDAILVQDLGLFHYVRTCYPDFPIHCSTQMHVHNIAGVQFMKEEGASRVVLARETSIEVIEEACRTGMEIEVFVYGAICISYSGQCLMSSSIKNRSANRGVCAQCCRLKYSDGKDKDGEYLLSPKDLNLIEKVPVLIDAGITSMKIEGRMKRPEYVYLAVKTFREAIDAYYAHQEYHVSAQRQKELLEMFNRGFSLGHIFHDDAKNRMNHYRPNHQGIEIGKVLQFSRGNVQVKLSDTLYQNDGLRIMNQPYDTGLTAVKIEKNGKLVNQAYAGDVVWLQCHSEPNPKPGQSLHRTSNVHLLKEIDQRIEEQPKKIPIHIRYEAYVDQPLRVILSDGQHEVYTESGMLCQKAQKAPVKKDRMEEILQKMDNEPYIVESIEGKMHDIFLPVSTINETRRNALQALNEERSKRFIRSSAKPYVFSLSQKTEPDFHILIKDDSCYRKEDVASLAHMPVINPNLKQKEQLENTVISEIGDFYMQMKDCIAGMTLNLANSYALAYVLSKPGIQAAVLSSELNQPQIKDALDAFTQRYGFVPFVYQLVYGKRTLMYIKDGFSTYHDLKNLQDFHGNLFKLDYNNISIVSILEHENYCSENNYCKGSYIIFEGDTVHKESVVEEAYEEIFRRI